MSIVVDPAPLYELRIVVLMETSPQSNKYRQIVLDQQQFRDMSQHLGKLVKMPAGLEDKSPIENYVVEFEDKLTYTLDQGIRSMKP